MNSFLQIHFNPISWFVSDQTEESRDSCTPGIDVTGNNSMEEGGGEEDEGGKRSRIKRRNDEVEEGQQREREDQVRERKKVNDSSSVGGSEEAETFSFSVTLFHSPAVFHLTLFFDLVVQPHFLTACP